VQDASELLTRAFIFVPRRVTNLTGNSLARPFQRKDEVRNRSVRVKGLPGGTQEPLLQQAFEKHGKVKSVTLHDDVNEATVEFENLNVSRTASLSLSLVTRSHLARFKKDAGKVLLLPPGSITFSDAILDLSQETSDVGGGGGGGGAPLARAPQAGLVPRQSGPRGRGSGRGGRGGFSRAGLGSNPRRSAATGDQGNATDSTRTEAAAATTAGATGSGSTESSAKKPKTADDFRNLFKKGGDTAS
jgi:RNA recognition motif-containing protein